MRLWLDKGYPIVISVAKGLAPFTIREVEKLGYEIIDRSDNTVVVKGDMHDVLRLNLQLRTAHRVLVPLLRCTCRNLRELYSKVNSIDWENLLDVDKFLRVNAVVHNLTVRDSRMPVLVTKDAIVDRMRTYCARRPNTGNDDSGAAVFVHWERDRAIVYLDTTGAPLSKRGYRQIPGSAPMQETLAAACIMAMEWNMIEPFVSPMCGSGTPAIEACMMAMNRAPGSLRSHFAFMAFKGYHDIIEGEKAPLVAPRQSYGASPEQIWKNMVKVAAQEECIEIIPPIIATDISPEAIINAQINATAAGVKQFIQFKACDFAQTEVPKATNGAVFFNPEYGIRLGEMEELKGLYERMGMWMNEQCGGGYTGAVLTGSPELSACVPLYYRNRVPFYNGAIDCRLFVYPHCQLKG